MGTHVVDIAGSLFKRRLNHKGEILSEISMLDKLHNRQDLVTQVKSQLEEK
jgi:hypothetical protein